MQRGPTLDRPLFRGIRALPGQRQRSHRDSAKLVRPVRHPRAAQRPSGNGKKKKKEQGRARLAATDEGAWRRAPPSWPHAVFPTRRASPAGVRRLQPLGPLTERHGGARQPRRHPTSNMFARGHAYMAPLLESGRHSREATKKNRSLNQARPLAGLPSSASALGKPKRRNFPLFGRKPRGTAGPNE